MLKMISKYFNGDNASKNEHKTIRNGLVELKDDHHEKIEKMAYFLWLENPENGEFENWMMAEKMIKELLIFKYE